MEIETECTLCGESASWNEHHHLQGLSDNHPKRRFKFKHLCHRCQRLYAPPKWFPETETDFNMPPDLREDFPEPDSDIWKSIQIKQGHCLICDNKTLYWLGTAEWANPETVIETVKDALSDSDESISWSHDTTDVPTKTENDEVEEVLTRSAPVCHQCVCSNTPETVFSAIRSWIEELTQYIDVTEPMWEEQAITKEDIVRAFSSCSDESG